MYGHNNMNELELLTNRIFAYLVSKKTRGPCSSEEMGIMCEYIHKYSPLTKKLELHQNSQEKQDMD